MDKIICKPKEGSNIFLVGCILFSVNCLYALWSLFNYVSFFTFVRLLISAAICVLFFLVYTERIKLFIPFILFAVNSFLGFVNGTIADSGILGFIALAAAIYSILCVVGVINFKLNLNLGNSLGGVSANESCLIGALAFMIIGIITVIRCALYLKYGLPALYILSTLCYFGGAVLVLLGSEPEAEYVADKTSSGYSYEEAASMAGGNANMNNGGNNSYSQNGTAGKSTYMAEGSLDYLLKTDNIVANVILSIITLGIFYIIWWYRVCKKIRILEKRDTSCGGELICILLVPFYSLYWYYTRAKRMSASAEANYNVHIDSNEVVYLVLALFGLGIVSMILMQSELNGFVEKYNANSSAKSWSYNRYENSQNGSGQNYNNEPKPEVIPENPVDEGADAAENTQPDMKPQEPAKEGPVSHNNNAEEIIETIKKLSELKDAGILSEEEFSAKKSELLQKM